MNRCNKYELMKKKDLYVVLGIIISGIAIAFIINTLLAYGNVIKTNLSNDSWLNFWGSYSSGIFAVVEVILLLFIVIEIVRKLFYNKKNC